MTMRYWINQLLPHIVSLRITRRRHRPHLAAEVLEVRALLSTFTVSNVADSGPCSLRDAIDTANSTPGADTIDFDSIFNTPQTITLTGSQLEFLDAATTTINGPAAGVTVSGGGLSRVFLVNLGSSASISRMTITEGFADNGGGVANFGDLTLTDSTVSGNSSDGYYGGGGIYSNGTLALISCSVSGNSASVNGGGVYVNDGMATLSNSIISDNSADYSGGGLYFRNPASLTLTGCTVSGNSATVSGGGIMNLYNMTMLTSCTVSGNTAGYGGGLYNLTGLMVLIDSTVSGNTATSGGGLYNFSGTTMLTNSTVSGNTATTGGGMFVLAGSATLTETIVADNTATYNGGGLYNIGTISLTDSTVRDNSATSGGGLWNGLNGSATLTDSTVSGNSSYGYYGGGGIYSNGTLALTSCSVSGNSASVNGGGVYVNDGTATLSNSIISGNSADYSGGGLNFRSAASVTLTDCTVSGNSATVSGGGIMNLYNMTMLTSCTVSGNTAGYGGGLYNLTGMMVLIDSTVSGNTATSGGGLYNFSGTTMLTNSTVSGNTATTGGGMFVLAGSATLTNTIVAENTNGFAVASDISGAVSGSYNLIGTGGSGGLVNGVVGNIVGVANALLAPLGNYGGPTQTMPLLPGSLAIDAGTGGAGIPGTDQRGMGRVGSVDIGAFESQGFVITLVADSTPQTAIVGNAFANALAVNVTANNPNEPVNGGVVTFVAAPAVNGASATFAGSGVISSGQASVTATANLIVGSYTVSASATGADPVSFALRNITTVVASATSVGWGSQTHVVAGRTNLSWTNISRFVLTFASPVAPTATDLTVTGRGGRVYNVNSVSVVGNTVTWTLTTPITTADVVTVTVNPLLAIYSVQLRILPGDVNDDGVVNSQDQVLVRNAFMGFGTPIPPGMLVFFDLNGDGVVNVTDYNLARSYNGTRL